MLINRLFKGFVLFFAATIIAATSYKMTKNYYYKKWRVEWREEWDKDRALLLSVKDAAKAAVDSLLARCMERETYSSNVQTEIVNKKVKGGYIDQVQDNQPNTNVKKSKK